MKHIRAGREVFVPDAPSRGHDLKLFINRFCHLSAPDAPSRGHDLKLGLLILPAAGIRCPLTGA